MVFTTFAFLKFILVVLLALRIAPARKWRQMVLLAASAYFYAYWRVAYLLLLATPSLIDYYAALRISESSDHRRKRGWLVLSLLTNFGLLAYFKYTNFLLASVHGLLGTSFTPLDIVLPVGISFYTFKTLSYTIDVYRGEIQPCPSLWQYAMFVTYFPELVAGPIVRASIFLPQMRRSLRPSWPRAALGLQLALLGATKKLLIADRLAVLADPVFAHPGSYAPLTVASAVVAYSLQIYCDFSGYSDIAIGVSKIIGYDLPENFNMPYLATSITAFWRRWHMTLSSWLRDYLYIPLGGGRVAPWRVYANLLITMLLGGLWHGASWTFVFWGAFHGLGLAVHKAWLGWSKRRSVTCPPILGWLLTYAFVCVGWVFFRAADFPTALVILRKMTGLLPGGVEWFYSPLAMLLPAVALAHWLGHAAEAQAGLGGGHWRKIGPPSWAAPWYADAAGRYAMRPSMVAGLYVLLPLPTFAGAFILTTWLTSLLLFGAANSNPFIYFQF
jgi:alginate O-acetyltransferase complex protein AlgI